MRMPAVCYWDATRDPVGPIVTVAAPPAVAPGGISSLHVFTVGSAGTLYTKLISSFSALLNSHAKTTIAAFLDGPEPCRRHSSHFAQLAEQRNATTRDRRDGSQLPVVDASLRACARVLSLILAAIRGYVGHYVWHPNRHTTAGRLAVVNAYIGVPFPMHHWPLYWWPEIGRVQHKRSWHIDCHHKMKCATVPLRVRTPHCGRGDRPILATLCRRPMRILSLRPRRIDGC